VRRLLGAALAAAALLVAVPAAHAAGAVDAPTKTVKVGAQTVGYRSIGQGRPIVMIMGLSGTMDAWAPTFVDALAATGHRVILFDNEGIGKTTALPGDLTIARMGDTTAGLIAALKLDTPDVMGWSMGGMIAQSFAVRHPGSLRRLVLMATAPGDGKAKLPRADAFESLRTASDPTKLLGLLFPADRTAERDKYLQDILRRKGVVPAAAKDVVDKQLAATTPWILGQDPDGAKVSDLKMPVIVAGAVKDWALPADNTRHLATIIPGAKRLMYSDAAHGFFLQYADVFIPRVAKFLRADG
jgi:pimeloyl-ACP methyl ester carboxylesterase